MTTSAKIICDSVGPNGVRLTTFVVTFPRFILPEFNTHRAFSRNGASSRAIPIKKQIDSVQNNPFIPKKFNKNSKGMQGAEILDEESQKKAELIWLKVCKAAIEGAEELSNAGISKQYANRLLESFNFTTMVITATELANFFALRHHSMAQPEIAELAKLMWEAYKTNTPKQLNIGDWHLPFITEDEIQKQWNSTAYSKIAESDDAWYKAMWLPLIKKSVARCARVSYNKHDGTNSTYEEDCALYDRLLAEQPIHASPAEHQAQAMELTPGVLKWSGNFRGWLQYRKTLKGENITSFEGPLG